MSPKESVAECTKAPQALKIVKNYMWFSMGAGLIPVPFVDLAAVSSIQLKMIAEISKVYDIPFSESRGKAIIGSLTGFILPHALAYGMVGSLIKAIPVVGALAGAPAMAVFCGAAAWALGNVFIQHFESGGTFLDFDPEKVREYFRSQFAEGHKLASKLEAEKAEAPV
jgi:uncharacterized protein (DUF697 family)